MAKKPKAIDCDLKIGERYTLEMKESQLKSMMGELMERYMMNYLSHNHRPFVKEIYPDIAKDKEVTIRPLRPDPAKKPIGATVKSPRLSTIKGWHGDLAIIINSKKYGMHAIIFEIKLGWCHISKPQHTFFHNITLSPRNYHPKLQSAKVYIVRLGKLDLDKCTVKVKIEPYQDRDRNSENESGPGTTPNETPEKPSQPPHLTH